MVSSAITPTRTIAVLIGVAVIAVAGFFVVRSGVFEPETVQGAIPGPGSSSPSASISESASAPPSPKASASPTTPGQIRAQNIADAKARLVEYYATTALVANNGYKDWETKLPPFWGHPDFHAAMRPVFTSYAEEGRYTAGAARVESMTVTSYEPSKVETEEVGLEACVDFAEVKSFRANGSVIARDAGVPTRYSFVYVMRNQGSTGEWTVFREVPESERAC